LNDWKFYLFDRVLDISHVGGTEWVVIRNSGFGCDFVSHN